MQQKRPYRNEKERQKRLKSVGVLSVKREQTQKDRAKKRAAQEEQMKQRCAVCDVTPNLRAVSFGSILYLCPVHYRQLIDAVTSKVSAMRVAFSKLPTGEVSDAGVPTIDQRIAD